MKRKITVSFLTCIICGLLMACAATERSHRDFQTKTDYLYKNCIGEALNGKSPNTTTDTIGLITQGHRLYGPHCYEQVITELFQKTKKDEPIVLFVHGRGTHPGKTVSECLIQDIRKHYGVSVLTFTWPSWEGWGEFPQEAAKQAGAELKKLIQALQKVKRDGEYPQRLALLTHSMGSLVLQGLVENDSGYPLANDLFETAVISASASSKKDHKSWVEKINFAKKIHIASNRRDFMLWCLEGKTLCKLAFGSNQDLRLGRNEDEILSTDKVTYKNFTGEIGVAHRYYINHEETCSFYKAALSGKEGPCENMD